MSADGLKGLDARLGFKFGGLGLGCRVEVTGFGGWALGIGFSHV